MFSLFALHYVDSDSAESSMPRLQENGNVVKWKIHFFTASCCKTHRRLVACRGNYSVFFLCLPIFEMLPTECDIFKTRSRTLFPAGRSIVNGALMLDVAKPAVFPSSCSLSFLLSHSSSCPFRPYRAPTSNPSHHSISASPVSQGYLHPPLSTTIIISSFFRNMVHPG